MGKANSEFKRHFPRWNKCCCCFSLKTGVVIATVLLILINLYSTYNSYNAYSSLNKMSMVGSLANVVVTIVLIVFLIGLSTNKVFLMKFIYIFSLYIIYYVIAAVFSYLMLSNGEYRKQIIEATKKTMPKDYKIDEQEIDRSIYFSKIYSVIVFVICFILYVYYFIACGSYIEDVEENEFEEKNIRYSEENEY